MGNFIITRKGGETFFRLEAENGQLLAASKGYATLDACKKGLVSLVTYAATSPLIDTTTGEKGPNPKFELVCDGDAYIFLLKAPNGKTVITSPPYATHKAALRALSMLRTGATDTDVLLIEDNLPRPLKIGKLNAPPAPAKEKKKLGRPAKKKATAPAPPSAEAEAISLTQPIVFDLEEEPIPAEPAITVSYFEEAAPAEPVPPPVKEKPNSAPVSPRVVRITPLPEKTADPLPQRQTPPLQQPRPAVPAKTPRPQKKNIVPPPPTVRGFIQKLFKK